MRNAIPLPSGPLPANYYTDNRSGVLIAVSVTFMVIEITAFGFRLAARHIKKRELKTRKEIWWDDVLIVPSLLVCLALCVLALVQIQTAGVGRHTLPVLEEDITMMVDLGRGSLVAGPILCVLAVNLPKLAIIAFYLRLFGHTSSVPRLTTIVLGLVIVLHTLVIVLITFLQCRPLSLLWTRMDWEGLCIDIHDFFRFASIPNIVTDIIILVLPLPMMYKLQTTTGKKVGVILVLLTGSIGLVTSIARLIAFSIIKPLSDPTWLAVDLYAYSIAEPGTYFLAANFITYVPLIKHLKDRYLFDGRGSIQGKEYPIGLITHPAEGYKGDMTETTISLNNGLSA